MQIDRWVVSSLAFRLDSGDGVKGRPLWLKSFFECPALFFLISMQGMSMLKCTSLASSPVISDSLAPVYFYRV
jgi:hypothetical protein